MAIATYIHDLLYRYECVILPGFGAFITQQYSARIDSSTNEFYPPKKVVSFNRQLISNDGLLANHIAASENISYKEATDKLHVFVQDLNSVLDKNNSVELSEIGNFKVSEGDKLQFEPFTQMNYLKDSFGLSNLTSQEVLRTDPEITATERKAQPTIDFPSERRSSGRYFRYAAVGLLAIGLSGFAGLNIYSDEVNEHNLAEQQKAAIQLEDQIQKATFIIDNPLPAITLKVSKQQGNYHIVAGAFREEENAAKKVKQLREEGFKARQIGANRFGLHQVIYSTYERRLDALHALRELKRTSNSGAWLLVQEL